MEQQIEEESCAIAGIDVPGRFDIAGIVQVLLPDVVDMMIGAFKKGCRIAGEEDLSCLDVLQPVIDG